MSDFLSPVINDVLKGDDMEFDDTLDSELRRIWQKAQVSGYQLGTKDADNKIVQSHEAIRQLFLDTIEKARPELLGVGGDFYTYDNGIKEFESNLLKEMKQ